jgi:hypothetical protein
MIATWLWSAFSIVRGSWITKWLSIALVGIAAYWGNNVIQRSIGEKRGISKVVKKSNEVARKRDAKIRTIRNRIDPNTAWEQLRKQYSSPN